MLEEVTEEDEGDGEAGFVFIYDDDIIDYIAKTRPDIPRVAAKAILDARQEYISTLRIYDADELAEMEVEGDEEEKG